MENKLPELNEKVKEKSGERQTAAGKRPRLSLASLIGQAILSSPEQKSRLQNIYDWIANRFPEYYQLNVGGWQNSIRHNLTINKAFIRVPKTSEDAPGKGAFWAIHPDSYDEFESGIFTGKIRGAEYRQNARLKKSVMYQKEFEQSMMRFPDFDGHLVQENRNKDNNDIIDSDDVSQKFGYNGPAPSILPFPSPLNQSQNFMYYPNPSSFPYNFLNPGYSSHPWMQNAPGAQSFTFSNNPSTSTSPQPQEPMICSDTSLNKDPFKVYFPDSSLEESKEIKPVPEDKHEFKVYFPEDGLISNSDSKSLLDTNKEKPFKKNDMDRPDSNGRNNSSAELRGFEE